MHKVKYWIQERLLIFVLSTLLYSPRSLRPSWAVTFRRMINTLWRALETRRPRSTRLSTRASALLPGGLACHASPLRRTRPPSASSTIDVSLYASDDGRIEDSHIGHDIGQSQTGIGGKYCLSTLFFLFFIFDTLGSEEFFWRGRSSKWMKPCFISENLSWTACENCT